MMQCSFVSLAVKFAAWGIYATLFLREARATASDWWFLPGDAYFESRLTGEFAMQISKLGSMESPLIRCHPNLASYDANCAIGGYGKLQIENFSERRGQMLAAIYNKIRSNVPPIYEIRTVNGVEQRRELNGLTLFIYNKDFDYKDFRVGIRYNEDWPEQQSKYIPLVFQSYFWNKGTTQSDIEHDWCFSRDVKPLSVLLPKGAPGSNVWDNRLVPIIIDNADIDIIVVVSDLFVENHRRGQGSRWFYLLHGRTAFSVSFRSDGEDEDEKWRVTDAEAELNEFNR